LAFHILKAALLGVTALATATALGPRAPSGGVPVYNKDVCGTNWVKVHIPNDSYFNFYNAPTGQARTCIKVEQHHLDFQISSIDMRRPWGYPNISSGWESDIYSCSSVKGACLKFPVQEKYDGTPVTSVATWFDSGVYNVAYDIWFNKTDAHPSQDNGTEIMIWIAHPGINVWAVSRRVTIDGIHWAVMTWTAYNSRAKKSWHYVAYVAVHQRSALFGLRLNPFFRNAIANRELSRNWWLTGIDFGFELVRGGLYNNVHFYKLTGVR
jgi:hypothetical protein